MKENNRSDDACSSIHSIVKTMMILQTTSLGDEKNFERGEWGNAFEGYFLPMFLIEDESRVVAAYVISKMNSVDGCS